MLLSRYMWIDSIKFKGMTQIIQWNQSINSILYVDLFWEIFYFVDFFFLENVQFRWSFLGNVRFRWPFLGRSIQFINSIASIIPVSQSQSTQSPRYFMKTNWLSHQSTHFEKELNRFNHVCGKNELIQVNELSRVDWYTSLVQSNEANVVE